MINRILKAVRIYLGLPFSPFFALSPVSAYTDGMINKCGIINNKCGWSIMEITRLLSNYSVIPHYYFNAIPFGLFPNYRHGDPPSSHLFSKPMKKQFSNFCNM